MRDVASGRAIVLFGTLRDPELLEIVLGRVADLQPVSLAGHGVFAAEGESFPLLAKADGAAQGVLLEGLSDEEIARLDFYEAPYGYTLVPVTLTDGRTAQVYRPTQADLRPGQDWSLARWQAEQGPVTREAAREIMALFGTVSTTQVKARTAQIRSRAQARLNARAKTPTAQLRRGYTDADVEVLGHRQAYANFFAVDELDLRHRRFDGDSQEVSRAVFVMADAVVVLPYDPVRDRVLVIEQFRVAPFVRGDQMPWVVETIAGRIDGGEIPEACAHREAHEEAGIALSELIAVSGNYPSPGAVTEFLHCFIGLADLEDGADGIGGVASEAEDIRSVVISFDALMGGIARGEVQSGPLILLALWLERERPRLRAAATSP